MSLEEQWVTVRVGNLLCGLNIKEIKEIVRLRHITPIPNTPDFVEGLTNLRGQIVTVIDLARRLATLHKGFIRYTRNQEIRAERIIVIQQNSELIGLHVDAVEQVLTLNQEEIEHLSEGELREIGIVDGVAILEKALVLILNTSILLRPIGEEGGKV